MLLRRTQLAVCALPCLAALAACGSGETVGTPTTTPLPVADLQRLYVQAADTYNTAEVPVVQAEYAHCSSGPGSPNLPACEQALSADRQATLSFDNAMRQLTFPEAARADVAKLLDDDSKLEALLEQAATAPSLTVIQSLSSQIFTLLNATTMDAAAVRKDIGLPSATAPGATPSPSP
ncbi:MAG: hypothetical protein JOY68_00740 [Candidatus Dormibacteraeota bacterium]|nr:hypothetical protein [Candidatus Dormibacteraeota bacterium]MBV8446016.1 hypothetical protein [Candidatus Dormibacteraeota bacterium]